MTTGRTLPEFQRVYTDGYDLSSYIVETGEQGVAFAEPRVPALADPIIGTQPSDPAVTCGPWQALFDNTATSGMHVLANAAQGTRRNILVAYGIQAAPAVGDPVFCVPALQSSYKGVGSPQVTATLKFAYDSNARLNYWQLFGNLLHVIGAETSANSSTAAGQDNGAASSKGGWLQYHITSITGTGTVTISVDDSADGTTYAALSGATSGAIATASAPVAGFVQLATTATVRRYLRWQIAFGGSATACTFALAFMRGI